MQESKLAYELYRKQLVDRRLAKIMEADSVVSSVDLDQPNDRALVADLQKLEHVHAALEEEDNVPVPGMKEGDFGRSATKNKKSKKKAKKRKKKKVEDHYQQ